MLLLRVYAISCPRCSCKCVAVQNEHLLPSEGLSEHADGLGELLWLGRQDGLLEMGKRLRQVGNDLGPGGLAGFVRLCCLVVVGDAVPAGALTPMKTGRK